MKIQTILLFIFSISLQTFGQSKIQWDFSYNQELDAIEMTATIADGWHLYSQHVDNEIGPVPTNFVFDENQHIKWIGKVNEPTPIQKYDETFEAMLDFFVGKVMFQQRLTAKKTTTVNGVVTYMLCNDTMCLPPTDEKFSIKIPN